MGAQVKVLQKGKVTIPANIRKALGVDEGDYLSIDLQRGQVIISPLGTMSHPTDAISGLVSGILMKESPDHEIAKAGAARAKRKLERRASK